MGTPEAQKIVSYFQELVENGKFKDKENYNNIMTIIIIIIIIIITNIGCCKIYDHYKTPCILVNWLWQLRVF